MNRAARACLIFALVVSAAIALAGYGVVMVTTNVNTACAGFVTGLAGLVAFIVLMRAWTDLS